MDTDEDPIWGPLKDRDLTELAACRFPHRWSPGWPSPPGERRRRAGGLVFHRNASRSITRLFAHSVGSRLVRDFPLWPAPDDLAAGRPPPAELATASAATPPACRLLVVAPGRRRRRAANAGRAPDALGVPRHLPRRGARPGRTRVSSGWSGAWPGRRRSGRDAPPTCPIRRPRRSRNLRATAPARLTTSRTSPAGRGCRRCASGLNVGTTVLPG